MSREGNKVGRADVRPVSAMTRRHVLAAYWGTLGVVEEGYPPWPIQLPRDIGEWDPDTAIAFMMKYLADKDRTHPPLSGSWVAIAEDAIASVDAQ